jgi:AcrR family transcriptional regulator
MPAKQPRRYELKERARRQEETRQRIVEATVALHEEVGPAQTTVAEIARRAGVQRLTVYNHFPDDTALLGACSARFMADHPMPDPGPWTQIPDPAARLRTAAEELYARHAATEAMTANVLRDADVVPALGAIVAAGRDAYESAVGEILVAGRGLRGRRKQRVRAAIGLALSFPTWQQLVRRGGLSHEDAVDVACAMVGAV